MDRARLASRTLTGNLSCSKPRRVTGKRDGRDGPLFTRVHTRCAHGEYSEYLDSTFQIGLLGQAEKADGSVGLVRSPSCYSTVG